MIFTYSTTVTCCRECPYSSNNKQEHDDPFSSGPVNIWWYCNATPTSRERVDIVDERQIAKNCPLNNDGALK